jgi:ankyrin repeat protein
VQCSSDAALCRACRDGDAEGVKRLIRASVDVNCRAEVCEHEALADEHHTLGITLRHIVRAQHDQTPLHLAAMSGHDSVCAELLGNDVNVNAVDSVWQSMLAAEINPCLVTVFVVPVVLDCRMDHRLCIWRLPRVEHQLSRICWQSTPAQICAQR